MSRSVATARNWLVGWYLVEYEQQGSDRATYGERLLGELARSLRARGVSGLALTNLKLCWQLYHTCPAGAGDDCLAAIAPAGNFPWHQLSASCRSAAPLSSLLITPCPAASLSLVAMKPFLALATCFLLSCSPDEPAPTITTQQLQCLNKRTAEVQRSIAANKQTFAGKEQDVYLFKTADGRVIGYLFEQGECSTVMTHLPANTLAQAEAFIAAEVKKNFGPLFITPENVQYKYYTAPIWQDTDTYLVAQAVN